MINLKGQEIKWVGKVQSSRLKMMPVVDEVPYQCSIDTVILFSVPNRWDKEKQQSCALPRGSQVFPIPGSRRKITGAIIS